MGFYNRIFIQVNKFTINRSSYTNPIRRKGRTGNGYKGKQCK